MHPWRMSTLWLTERWLLDSFPEQLTTACASKVPTVGGLVAISRANEDLAKTMDFVEPLVL